MLSLDDSDDSDVWTDNVQPYPICGVKTAYDSNSTSSSKSSHVQSAHRLILIAESESIRPNNSGVNHAEMVLRFTPVSSESSLIDMRRPNLISRWRTISYSLLRIA
jgi:hypothetical protein